jgi:hypothetical protein
MLEKAPLKMFGVTIDPQNGEWGVIESQFSRKT